MIVDELLICVMNGIHFNSFMDVLSGRNLCESE
jgi:hypothetical protein